MHRDTSQETPKQSHTGVITRSRRKNSLLSQDCEERTSAIPSQSHGQKRAQIGEEGVDLDDFQQLQKLFANFVEALNSKDSESISDRVKRGTRRKMLTTVSEDVNGQTRSLKRVKRETRKMKANKKVKDDLRKTSKKIAELEPIEEDVKKENLVNGEDSSETRQLKSKIDSKTGPEIESQSRTKDQHSQLEVTKLDSKKQNLDKNFNGKIPAKSSPRIWFQIKLGNGVQPK